MQSAQAKGGAAKRLPRLVGGLLFIIAAVVMQACGKQEPRGKQGGGTVTVKEPKLERDVPEMGATYKEAFEEARKEITKDNAEDMLDEIEHDVNKGQ